MSGVAFLVCLIAPLDFVGGAVEQFVQQYGLFVNVLLIVTAVAVAWVILCRLGCVHFGHRYNASLRTSFKWPPVWLCGVVSFCGLACFLHYELAGTLVSAGVFCLGLPIGRVIWRVFTPISKSQEEVTGKKLTRETIEELIAHPERLNEWVKEEKPIEALEQDRFDMALYARRMAKMLLGTPLKSIAVVGEYGSGKSSILNMLDYYLKQENRGELNNCDGEGSSYYADESVDIIVCSVDGWGFTKGTTAEHILECAINKLSEYIDTSSLRNIPEQYRAAMNSTGNMFVKALGGLLRRWESPRDILRRIDRVLWAIDHSLVIFLEDIDRNRSNELFFNEIAALLDGLKGLKRVAFVLAIGQRYSTEEVLTKSADYVEHVSRIDRNHVFELCKSVRSYCLKPVEKAVTLLPIDKDEKRMGWRRSKNVEAVAEIDDSLNKPIDAIAELMGIPRVFKRALRRTLTTWETLAGEIDFDDLLIVNVLRTVDIRIFTFIDKNIARLSYLVESKGNKEDLDKVKAALEKEFNDATKEAEYNVDAVRMLMWALFPGWAMESLGSWMTRQHVQRHQSIANSWPTKYWERIKRGELYNNEIRDREILAGIEDWNRDINIKSFGGLNMREALCNERAREKAQQFKDRIDPKCLREVVSNQFALSLETYGNNANREVCPAVGTWFLLGPDTLDRVWEDWLFEEICKALPLSLRYTNDLYKLWYAAKHDAEGKLRERIVERAKDIFEKDPQSLAKALDPEYVWSVWHFAGLYSQVDRGGKGFDPGQWKWLGNILLEAGKEYPEVIGLHAAALVCDSSRSFSRGNVTFSGKFNKERAEGIFSGQMDTLMELLQLKNVDIAKYDNEEGKSLLVCAREVALNWPNKEGSGKKNDA